jgi:hypothetical protein
MFLDEDGPLERASGTLALLAMAVDLVGLAIILLFLYTNKHLTKQITLQFLPRLSILADTERSIQA